MKEFVKKCFFKALLRIFSGSFTDCFWQFFPAGLLQVQSTCLEHYLLEKIIFLQEIGSLRRFLDFEGEIFEPLSKKFQKGCKKNPFMSQEEHCEWIFFPKYFMSILLFGHWEKNSRLPSKRFQEGYRNKCRRLQVKQIERKKLCLIFFSEFREKHWNFGDSFSAVLS